MSGETIASAPALAPGIAVLAWKRAMLAIHQAAVLATLVVLAWYRFWPINLPGFDSASVPFPYMQPATHLSEIVALAAVAAFALAGWPGLDRLWRGPQLAFTASLLGLLGLAALSPLWAIHRGLAALGAAHMAIWVLFALVMASSDLPGPRLATFILAGVLVQSAYGIAQVALQHFVGWPGSALGELPVRPQDTWVSVVFAGPQRLLRAYGLSGHPNALGGYVAIGLLLAYGLLLTWPRVWRALIVPAWAIAWALLLITFSRSAWIVMPAGGLASLVLLARGQQLDPHARKAAATLAVIALALSIVLGIVFRPFVAGRVENVDQPIQSRSFDERAEMLNVALQMVAAHPILGVGAANFSTASRAWTAGYALDWVHNVPLLVAGELGLPGLALFLVMLGALVVTGVRRWRSRSISIWQALTGAGLVALIEIMFLDHYLWTAPHGALLWALLSGWWMQDKG